MAKKSPGRWVRLVRASSENAPVPSGAAPGSNTSVRRAEQKNWERVSNTILESEKDKTMQDDPNAVDSNRAFSELFQHLDDDAKRAMLKSYTESGGTTLSTDWSDVKKGPVSVKPPEGQEWKKWG
jgi:suppressor of G2 allele of SKP1